MTALYIPELINRVHLHHEAICGKLYLVRKCLSNQIPYSLPLERPQTGFISIGDHSDVQSYISRPIKSMSTCSSNGRRDYVTPYCLSWISSAILISNCHTHTIVCKRLCTCSSNGRRDYVTPYCLSWISSAILISNCHTHTIVCKRLCTCSSNGRRDYVTPYCLSWPY